MRIVSLFDVHVPYQINLKPIFKFIRDFKPDVVVLGGDQHHWEPASHWISDKSTTLEGQSIKKCYKEIHDVLLNPLKEVITKGCKIKYLIGNHDQWVQECIELSRNGAGYWEPESNIDLKHFNMEIIPENGAYQPCTNLIYIHGIFANEFSAKKTVQAYHNSVIFGHTHTIQVYTDVSPVNVEKFYTGKSVGCLCSLNPSYALNKPNKWVNGFSFTYINDKTEEFSETTVIIVHSGFWALGRYYR